MNDKEEKQISLDIIKHLEDLSNKVNSMMAERAKNVLTRYPVLFALLILIGATAVHEGLKGIMKEIGFLDLDPLYLLFAGLVILLITGTLYKKLDK